MPGEAESEDGRFIMKKLLIVALFIGAAQNALGTIGGAGSIQTAAGKKFQACVKKLCSQCRAGSSAKDCAQNQCHKQCLCSSTGGTWKGMSDPSTAYCKCSGNATFTASGCRSSRSSKFKYVNCRKSSDCGKNSLCSFGDGYPPSSWCVAKNPGDCTQSSDCSTGKSCVFPPPGGGNIGHCEIVRTSHPGTHRPPVNGPGATPSGGGSSPVEAGECVNPNGCIHDGEAI